MIHAELEDVCEWLNKGIISFMRETKKSTLAVASNIQEEYTNQNFDLL